MDNNAAQFGDRQADSRPGKRSLLAYLKISSFFQHHILFLPQLRNQQGLFSPLQTLPVANKLIIPVYHCL